MKNKPHGLRAFQCSFCREPVMLGHYTLLLDHTDEKANTVVFTVCEACVGALCQVLIQLGLEKSGVFSPKRRQSTMRGT